MSAIWIAARRPGNQEIRISLAALSDQNRISFLNGRNQAARSVQWWQTCDSQILQYKSCSANTGLPYSRNSEWTLQKCPARIPG